MKTLLESMYKKINDDLFMEKKPMTHVEKEGGVYKIWRLKTHATPVLLGIRISRKAALVCALDNAILIKNNI